MHKKILILSYVLFVLLGALPLVLIPDALTHAAGSVCALVIFSLPLLYFLRLKFGWKVSLLLLASLGAFALVIEYIGLVTGWPYGDFSYTGHIGYKILGVLPWTVALSWTPLVLGSVALTYQITKNNVARIVLPVILLVLFDLLLDPVAVHLGMWSYLDGGAYYGVPIQNFAGWVLSGSVGSLISFSYLRNALASNWYELACTFCMSITFWTIVALGRGLYVPALFGFGLAAFCGVIYCKNYEKVS